MTTDQPKFNLYTASAEEMAAHVAAEHRKREDNALYKLKNLSDLRFRLLSDEQLMLNWIDFENRGRTPEVIAAHRRYVQAEIDWLEANPGDDLTPERIGCWVQTAREGLPLCTELNAAVSWVKEVDEYREGDPQSETLRKLVSKRDEAIKDVGRQLAYALLWNDVEFLTTLDRRTHRFQRRFMILETGNFWDRKTLSLRGVSIYVRHKRFLVSGFDYSIRNCRTIAEVKRVCAIWHTPIKVELRDGSKFVVGEGFEVVPQ